MPEEDRTKEELIEEIKLLKEQIGKLEILASERKLAENEILRSKQFSESIINSLPGIFYLFDRNGKILRVNERFLKASTYSLEEVLKMHPLDFFSSEEKKKVEDKIKEVFEKGESSVEADFLSKDGIKTPYYFTGYRIMIDNALLLVGLGIDITERKRLEEESNKRLHEMEVFYKASIGREERILELKEEIEILEKKIK